jgi:MFS family permease
MNLSLLPFAFYQALVGAPLWLYVSLPPGYALFADPRPPQVGGGVLGDIWRTEERGKAIAIYSLAPLLGPVVGPICGGWIAERSTWRWVVSASFCSSHCCMLMDSSFSFGRQVSRTSLSKYLVSSF